jgi:peptidyl-tRNA hydrolase, PTH1 family
MKLIVGLGNPGDKYEGTRHNLGFIVVEQLLKDYEPVEKTVWSKDAKLKSDVVRFDWQPKGGADERIILAKPMTYMNNSGMAVELLRNYYKVDPSDIWIVHDELDLPLGSMKIRLGGAAAGHHGVESIMAALGTDKFWRFRLGIGVGNEKHTARQSRENGGNEKLISRRKIHSVEDFVLGRFTVHDKGKIKELTKAGSKALQIALEKGMKAAQNRYNTK